MPETAGPAALGNRCACWCAAISCDTHIYYFYHQHAFKHRPLVPSAVEPPVLLRMRCVQGNFENTPMSFCSYFKIND